jgi:dCTP deaminase
MHSLVTPFSERTVVRGRSFGLSHCGFDVRIAESMTLEPGEFRLASTIEHFSFPLDLVGLLKDKSSWARQGLSVFNTVFEPGWRGHATLELANHGPNNVLILGGDPIAQMIFTKLVEPTESAYAGKYQDQEAGPQEARLEQ